MALKEPDHLKILKSPQPVCVYFVVLKEVKTKTTYLGVKKAAFRVYSDFSKTFDKLLLSFHPKKLHGRVDVKVVPGTDVRRRRDVSVTAARFHCDRRSAARNRKVRDGVHRLPTVQKY